VKFPADMLHLIAKAARKCGMNLSEYIREALVEKLRETDCCKSCGQPHPAAKVA
jgi:hypothetical protein